jgi:hypothetical protein
MTSSSVKHVVFNKSYSVFFTDFSVFQLDFTRGLFLYGIIKSIKTPVTTFDHTRAPGNTTTVSPHQFMGARRTRGIGFVICCLAFVLGLHHCSANGNTPSKLHHINTAKPLNMPTNLMILTPSIRPKPKHTRPNPPIYCCPCASLDTCRTADCPCWAAGKACTKCCPHDTTGLCQRKSSGQQACLSPQHQSGTAPTHNNPIPQPPLFSVHQLQELPVLQELPDKQNSQQLQVPHPTPAHAVPDNSDLPDFQKSSADAVLSQLYGDHVHWNDSTHLHGGIDPAKDTTWQQYYNNLSNFLPMQYDLPRGPIAGRFLQM